MEVTPKVSRCIVGLCNSRNVCQYAIKQQDLAGHADRRQLTLADAVVPADRRVEFQELSAETAECNSRAAMHNEGIRRAKAETAFWKRKVFAM